MNSLFGKSLAALPIACFLLAFASVGSACKNQNKMAASDSEENTVQEIAGPTDSISLAEATETNADSLLISLERTACFGRCPIYKVQVFESGFAIYEGRNFVDRMGLFSTNIDQSRIDKMLKEADEVGFFAFEERYDFEGLMDVPSTIVSIANDGVQKQVVARYDVPKNVTKFINWLDEELEQNNWKAYAPQ